MDEPKRRRWRKKRWIAAGFAWLATVFATSPLLVGPLAYLSARGTLPFWCYEAADAAVAPVVGLTPYHHDYANYVGEWYNRALNERLAEAMKRNPDAIDFEF